MLSSVESATLLGVEGQAVTVEVHVSRGLPSFTLVGLPDEACRESRDRVRAALLSSGIPWPAERITVNLAGVQHRKGGSGLDLAIAVGIVVATGLVPAEAVHGVAFVGELGLDGSLRGVPGVAPMAAAVSAGMVVVPMASASEVRAAGRHARVASNVCEVVSALAGSLPWPDAPPEVVVDKPPVVADLRDVRGQPFAKLALEVAAAGRHHMLLVGPPGAGKTMLAQRITGLLPPLSTAAALQTTMVHSAAGITLPPDGVVRQPPFRSPHHSCTMVALVGGGSQALRPGEVSLATGGVLFLDELGEFAPAALDALRQPLEEGVVRIARSRANAVLPADFLLIAATNPCPCGQSQPGACLCDDAARARYLRRLSGPLLDRFDVRVAVARPATNELLGEESPSVPPSEPSAVVARRVGAARHLALDRQGVLNGALSGAQLDEFAPMKPAAREMLRAELDADRLSGRGFHRIRRIARTLADLSGDEVVSDAHVALALNLRVSLGAAVRSAA